MARRCTAVGCGASQPEGYTRPGCYFCGGGCTTTGIDLGSFDGAGVSIAPPPPPTSAIQCNWCDRVIPPGEKMVLCKLRRHHDRPMIVCEVCAQLERNLGLLSR